MNNVLSTFLVGLTRGPSAGAARHRLVEEREREKDAQFCKLGMAAMKNHFGCPVQATSNVLAGKWKVLIVWHLSFRSYRFAELRELLPGVSEKVLTSQLRELEHDGVVGRRVSDDTPPRVDYFLTEAGNELIPVMEGMCAWGVKHLGVPPSLPRLGPTVATPQ